MEGRIPTDPVAGNPTSPGLRERARSLLSRTSQVGCPKQRPSGGFWLDNRLAEIGMPDITPWWHQIAPLAPHIAHDPEIRELAVRLDDMAIAGVDVTAVLTDAINDGPLPADHTLAALTYRLERHQPRHTTHQWPPLPEHEPLEQHRRHRHDEPIPGPHPRHDRGIGI